MRLTLIVIKFGLTGTLFASTSIGTKDPFSMIPALATTTSTVPYSSIVLRKSSSCCSQDVTSQVWAIAWLFENVVNNFKRNLEVGESFRNLPNSCISLTTFSAPLVSRSAMTSLALIGRQSLYTEEFFIKKSYPWRAKRSAEDFPKSPAPPTKRLN